MATFYTGVDKSIYEGGDHYLPMDQFRLNPYEKKDLSFDSQPQFYGITNTDAFTNSGGGGGALQAGDINFDDFNRLTTENYMRKQPTPFVDMNYNQKIQDKFFGLPSYRKQELTGPDLGEYIGGQERGYTPSGELGFSYGTDVPLELTGAGKMKQGWRNTKEGVAAMMGKIPSISGVLNKLGVQNFQSLSPLDQRFIKQSSGYTGPTVFGDQGNMEHSVDPFGKNIESLFGNYAQGVRDDVTKLNDLFSATGKGSLQEKYGVTWDEDEGIFKGANAKKAMDKTKMLRTRLNFRNQQINKQEQDEIVHQKNEAAEKARDAKIADETLAKTGGTEEWGEDMMGGTDNDYGFDDSGGFIGEGWANGGRVGYNRGRVVNPGGYAGDDEGGILEWIKSKMGSESETNPTVFGTQNSLLNQGSIAQLQDAIKSYEALMYMGELDEEQQADYELKLNQLEALEQGAQGQAQGGRVGLRYGGLLSIL